MYNGAGQAPSIDDVFSYSEANKCAHYESAAILKSPHIKNVTLWPEPQELSRIAKIDNADFVSYANGSRKDILSELCRQIDGYLQFPPSSIFLHGLGVISSAMCRSFYIDYGGGDDLPVSLYTIVAQPPSTGKSEVNRKLYTPVAIAYRELNETTRTERERVKREIATLNRKLDATSKSAEKKNEPENWSDIEEIIDRIHEKEKRLKEIPEWKPAYTNATIEAIEMGLEDGGGMFSIVSAEADSINIVAGAAYGDKNSKSNVNLLLGAWDNEEFSGARTGRLSYQGKARGCIAVIAQDDTIDTMLAAGASGRGLTERFLMLSEKPKLGYRDHDVKYSFDRSIYNQYKALIRNIVHEEKIVFNFDAKAENWMRLYKKKLEPTMQAGSKNSHNLITGFIGKADKQIRRIAAVLHAIDNWADGGDRARTIGEDYVTWAFAIYDKLSETFINSADFMGYVGDTTRRDIVCEKLIKIAGKGGLKTSVNALRGMVRNNMSFSGSNSMSLDIENAVQELSAGGYCYMDGKTIYINPRLK